MPYTIPSFPAIRQRMLRDAANLDPTAPQDRDSDLYVQRHGLGGVRPV